MVEAADPQSLKAPDPGGMLSCDLDQAYDVSIVQFAAEEGAPQFIEASSSTGQAA